MPCRENKTAVNILVTPILFPCFWKKGTPRKLINSLIVTASRGVLAVRWLPHGAIEESGGFVVLIFPLGTQILEGTGMCGRFCVQKSDYSGLD